MIELKPMNKHVWIEPISSEGKVGSLYVVSHSQNSHQLARVLAFAECAETDGLKVGDTVLYDSLGAYSHRIGKQTVTTVKALNIISIVNETVLAYNPEDFEIRRVSKDTPDLIDPRKDIY